MAIRGIFLLAFLVLGRVEDVQAACSMTELQNKNIPDQDLTGSFGATTAQECSNGCLNRENCYFARFDDISETCDFSTNPGTVLFSDTITIAKKECVEDTTTTTPTTTTTTPTTTTTTSTTTTTATTTKPATECIMSPTTTKAGSGTPTPVDLSSSAYCSLGCKSVKRCSHSEYVQDTNTCNFYSSWNIFKVSGRDLWKKDTCPTGDCCFDLKFATNDGKTPVLSLTSSLDSCKIMCLKWDPCVAALFSASTCTMYGSTISSTSSSTLYVKSCPGGATSSEAIDPLCQAGQSIQPVSFLVITSTAGVMLLKSTSFL
ncbi:unnamed protein product [Lymnaea stagnalis]|uniref:Apple domain-containing protein n=1 Tax=Lymnaea stagnalis TaxID=6523 RepID=A0AAV2H287_LYMST